MPRKPTYIQSSIVDGVRYNGLRYKKQPRVGLPNGEIEDVLNSPEYKAALKAAIANDKPVERKKKSRGGDSVREIVRKHMESVHWRNLEALTRRARTYTLMNWVEGYTDGSGKYRSGRGDVPVYDLNPDELGRELERRKACDGLWAARNWLIAVRMVVTQLKKARELDQNFDPTYGLKGSEKKVKRTKDDGYKTTPTELLQRYLAHYSTPGSPERVAGMMLYVTGAACSDVIRFCLSDIDSNGLLHYKRKKTGTSACPDTTPELMAEITAAGIELGPIVRTRWGRAFTSGQMFSKAFAKWWRDAGLPAGYSAHGIRKRAACDDAMAGRNHKWLMSKYGWETSAEADLYIREAEKILVMLAGRNPPRAA